MAVVKHFSHKHPLCHAEVKEEDGFVCSGCEVGLSGSAYKCTISNYDFFLHDSFFKLAPVIKHKSHPHHPLSLFPSPPYDDSGFTCEACLYYGHAFVYHCAACQFDLHVGCASLPESVEREDHEHPLVLFFSAYKGEDSSVMCAMERSQRAAGSTTARVVIMALNWTAQQLKKTQKKKKKEQNIQLLKLKVD